jgi:ribosomal protein S3AE
MSPNRIEELLRGMDPEAALAAMAKAAKKIFPLLNAEAKVAFWINLLGEPGGDKVTSMVHL